jgi:hypothetical protein
MWTAINRARRHAPAAAGALLTRLAVMSAALHGTDRRTSVVGTIISRPTTHVAALFVAGGARLLRGLPTSMTVCVVVIGELLCLPWIGDPLTIGGHEVSKNGLAIKVLSFRASNHREQ